MSLRGEGGTVWVVEDVGGTDAGDFGPEVCYVALGNDE